MTFAAIGALRVNCYKADVTGRLRVKLLNWWILYIAKGGYI